MSDPKILGPGVLIEGFQRAHSRFVAVAKKTRDPAEVFYPLFEALSWAASADERLGYPEQDELRGIRFARNRIHHQWADALFLDTGELIDTRFLYLPLWIKWRWHHIGDLPASEIRDRNAKASTAITWPGERL